MIMPHPFYRSQKGFETLQKAYDDELMRWPMAPDSQWVKTRLGTTHVLSVGERQKPPLIYFHGWNGTAAGNHIELDLPRLTQFYCIYMPDTPGHPGRSAEVRPDTRGTVFADWAADMCDALGLERVFLAGVSGGGYLASKAAAHLGHRVRRALGIVPHGLPPSSYPPLRFFMLAIPGMVFGGSRLRYFVSRMGSPVYGDQNINMQGLQHAMALMMAHFKPATNPLPLTDDELRGIVCPFYALFGRYDITMKTEAAAERTRRLIPQAEVRILEDEGHIFSPAGWQQVNSLLCSWVSDQGNAG